MRVVRQRKSAQAGMRVSGSLSMPAPVGGWNAHDALADMAPTDAVALDNWMPQTNYVEIRGGYASHATGMTGNGKTLAVYNKMAGSMQMFCATASGIYNVSSAGAVGASVLARTNGKHQWVVFGDSSGLWLIMVNGVDAPAYYDGTTWTAVTGATTPALSGVTLANLISVNVFKGRLFFIEKNSLSFWYLAAGAAGGALTEFSLKGEAKRGGYLMAMATWTRDAGDGADDVAVFVTSEGEAIVYQGTNPGSAAAWAKIGSFFIGKPLGRRCIIQYGGDCIILTQNGTFPLSAAMQSASIDYKYALSFKIERAFTDVARTYGSTFGWEAIVYPAQNALLVNIPKAEDGEHEQYVMNTITKSWCRFTEWDAEAFAVFNGELYFATGTTVKKAWTGQIDGANNIEAYGKTAFSHFGKRGIQKKVNMFMPILAVNGPLAYLTDIDADFRDGPIVGSASYTVTSGAQWDVSHWDQSYWAAGLEVVRQWQSPTEWAGEYLSGKLKIATNSLRVQWMSTTYVYEEAAIL